MDRRIGFFLAGVLLMQLLSGCVSAPHQPAAHAGPEIREVLNAPGDPAFQGSNPTPTPFQPISSPALSKRLVPVTTPAAGSAPPPQDPLNFYGIDFSDHKQWVSLQILPPDSRINRGKPIQISFIPGQRCNFGDHHGCINPFTTQENGEAIFITVHSGVGGEGQRFRNALEGTGIDRAGLPLQRVQANMKVLLGSDAAIAQGNTVIGGLKLTAIARIPASSLATYFNTPLDQVLALAASIDPTFLAGIDPGQPQIIFETCGWKMPGEPWAAAVTSTTGSIYIGVIQRSQ